jgi:hypothetical protein
MTRDEIIADQAKEKEFLATPIGAAFHRFRLAHSRYWQSYGSDTISHKRLNELAAASHKAEQEFRDLILAALSDTIWH